MKKHHEIHRHNRMACADVAASLIDNVFQGIDLIHVVLWFCSIVRSSFILSFCFCLVILLGFCFFYFLCFFRFSKCLSFPTPPQSHPPANKMDRQVRFLKSIFSCLALLLPSCFPPLLFGSVSLLWLFLAPWANGVHCLLDNIGDQEKIRPLTTIKRNQMLV